MSAKRGGGEASSSASAQGEEKNKRGRKRGSAGNLLLDSILDGASTAIITSVSSTPQRQGNLYRFHFHAKAHVDAKAIQHWASYDTEEATKAAHHGALKHLERLEAGQSPQPMEVEPPTPSHAPAREQPARQVKVTSPTPELREALQQRIQDQAKRAGGHGGTRPGAGRPGLERSLFWRMCERRRRRTPGKTNTKRRNTHFTRTRGSQYQEKRRQVLRSKLWEEYKAKVVEWRDKLHDCFNGGEGREELMLSDEKEILLHSKSYQRMKWENKLDALFKFYNKLSKLDAAHVTWSVSCPNSRPKGPSCRRASRRRAISVTSCPSSIVRPTPSSWYGV